MSDFLKEFTLEIGESADTAFVRKNGVYQDGTTPFYRDVDGKLWAITGHSHMGQIGMFCGTTVDNMEFLYPISTNFAVGHADYAFNNIRYPEGVKARGSVWPMGLYICPKTHRFFSFFHNESGWNGKGTAYDSFGLCNTPKYDSDFRHIGLMHSDDEGRNWTFDRWVLTGETVGFTDRYSPEGDKVIGQSGDSICLGSGDFSFFANPNDDYLYLIYNQAVVNLKEGYWESCHAYIARTRKREDGIMGDFVKYYEGEFCEPGNFGKESPIIENAWHTRFVYLKKYDLYVASYTGLNVGQKGVSICKDYMELRTSKDFIHWSEPVSFEKDGKKYGNHYCALVPTDDKNPITVIEEDDFAILLNHNGTDVTKNDAKFVKR